MTAKYDVLNPPALRRLIAQGTQLRPFPQEILEASWKAANELYDETSAKNAMFKKVYGEWRKFRDEQILWFRVAEARFDSFMQQMSAKAAAAPKK